jgi:hypothetical protein
MRSLRYFPIAIVAALLVAGAGCSRDSGQEPTVRAQTVHDFTTWRARFGDKLTPEQWGEFDHAVQEIRLAVARTGEATGSGPVDAAMRAKIDGRTVREVIALGYDAQLGRLGVDRDVLVSLMERNATLQVRPGDTASADYLQRKRDDQLAELKKIDEQIAAVREKRAATGVPVSSENTGAPAGGEGTSKPPAKN